MKKFVSIIILFLTIFVTHNQFYAQTKDVPQKKIRVLCTILPMYILTANIIKGTTNVELSLLLTGQTGCPHEYTLTPGDLSKIAGTDILIINGLGIDSFLPDNLRETYPDLKIIFASQGITDLLKYKEIKSQNHMPGQDADIPSYIAEPIEEYDLHDAANQGSGVDVIENFRKNKNEFNPHLWSSPLMAQQQLKNIASGLCSFDRANSDKYLSNYEKYSDVLKSLLDQYSDVVKSMKHRQIITVHSTLDYLARDTGLEIADTVFPIVEHELSPSDIIRITQSARRYNVIAIVTEPQFSPNTAGVISRETGKPVIELDPVITGEASAQAYETAMKKNIEVLKRIAVSNDQPKQ